MSEPVSLVVENRPTKALIPYARNSRTHSDAQIAQIAGSIREFGFVNPVLIDPDGGIIAGHGRVLAAMKIGLVEVPCIVLGHLTATQRRALVIADNRIALSAGWDEDMLVLELQDLQGAEFDLSMLGFDIGQLGRLLGDDDPEDDPGIAYQEKYAVLVECNDEPHQAEVFQRLTGDGYACKVLVN